MSEQLKVSGVIHEIFELNQVSEKFTKQEFILKTEDEQYPQLIKFQCTQNRCDQLAHKEVGQKATIHFNLRGREWVNKENKTMYFNSLDCWRIEAEAVNTPAETIDNSELPF
jgi:hypothetical protein